MTSPTNTHTGLDRFFDRASGHSFRRSDDRMIAGVCGAVAERLGVSRKAVRIAAVVLAFFGPMLGIYLLAWLVLPDSSGRTMVERGVRGGEGKAIALAIVTALILLGDIGFRLKFVWPLLIVGGIVVLVMSKARRGGAGGRPGSGQPTAYGAPTAYGPASFPQQSPQDAPRW
jgi:phage shock protein PspC (stress-responsive transcriptional regulator)